MAQSTGSVAVLLNQIPNGRITFEEDTAFPGGRSGDRPSSKTALIHILKSLYSLKVACSVLSFRTEKSLIAYSWRRFMEENGDDHSRLLLAPMVKAAVLAMNATNDILHEQTCGKTQLSEGRLYILSMLK